MLYLEHGSWTQNKATVREAHPMDQDRIVFSLPCEDAGDRPGRKLFVIGTPGRLTIACPPGGTAHLHPRQYDALHQAIRDVLTVAWTEVPPEVSS